MIFVNRQDAINYKYIRCMNNGSTIQFSEFRSESKVVEKIREEIIANGLNLNNEAFLLQKLENSEYVPILKALWSETDEKVRLEWLRSHAGYHAPLMYELAIEEFVNTPSMDTYRKISIPLMKAAAQRAFQDANCLIDLVAAQLLPHTMDNAYQKALLKEVNKYTDLSIDHICRFKSLTYLLSDTRIKEALKAVDTPGFPNPQWISYDIQFSGTKEESKTLFVNVVEQKLLMRDEEQWTFFRKEFTEEFLRLLNMQNL